MCECLFDPECPFHSPAADRRHADNELLVREFLPYLVCQGRLRIGTNSWWPVDLDPTGLPLLTDELREKLEEVVK